MSKKVMSMARRAAMREPEFASPGAAARHFRKWRNSELRKLEKAAARAGCELNGSVESLESLERWVLTVDPKQSSVLVGMPCGALVRRVSLYRSVLEWKLLGSDWVVVENFAVAGRYELFVRDIRGSYTAGGIPDEDKSLWTSPSPAWASGSLRQRLAEDSPMQPSRILPFAARLSLDPATRFAERIMLARGLNPWKRSDLPKAVQLHGVPFGILVRDIEPLLVQPGAYSKELEEVLRRLAIKHPAWRESVIELIGAHQPEKVLDLCAESIQAEPVERGCVAAMPLIDRLDLPSWVSRVASSVDQWSRRKRKFEAPKFFYYACRFLSRHPGPESLHAFELLDSRGAKLSLAEREAIRTARSGSNPTSSRSTQGKLVTVRGSVSGRPFTRRLFEPASVPQEAVIVDDHASWPPWKPRRG